VATTLKQLMDTANAAVPRITPAQAQEMIAQGNTLVLDVREPQEVEKTGKVAGAVNVSRGFLEFRADRDSPSHDKNFAKDKNVIVYCASGGRAALSGKLLKDMGYERVYNLGASRTGPMPTAKSRSERLNHGPITASADRARRADRPRPD